ncbi:hypothetical protein DPMN_121238 [Dreissena polymorpha]|uniref:MULE transposase domain-containing protein n=1 Tax=Dreissena polymorpha TaxID=45954 RepID=A0A9D4JP95_DREPO|nr:hypothetical protein DPMN_121238 [Dreissena polymorpha]
MACATLGFFPTSQLKGCAFHWSQAVLRRINEVGLKTTYERREAIHDLMSKMMAIPFLPTVQIPRAFNRYN